jgi:hypothetical protein
MLTHDANRSVTLVNVNAPTLAGRPFSRAFAVFGYLTESGRDNE